MILGKPIVITEDVITRTLLVGLQSGVVLRIGFNYNDLNGDQTEYIKDLIVSWVCDVLFSQNE